MSPTAGQLRRGGLFLSFTLGFSHGESGLTKRSARLRADRMSCKREVNGLVLGVSIPSEPSIQSIFPLISSMTLIKRFHWIV